MILKKLVVGNLGTSSYIFGSSSTLEVVIIDPGGNANKIIKTVEELGAKPLAVLLTHGHFDHTLVTKKIQTYFKIPLMYNRNEFDSGIFKQIEADRWLKEGDTIKIGEITLNVLETPGHSPGSLCYYSKDAREFEGNSIDGIMFTGDLIFRRSIGRSDLRGGNSALLFSSIRDKIMRNPEVTDNVLLFPGHMESTSVGEERKFNMFKNYFL